MVVSYQFLFIARAKVYHIQQHFYEIYYQFRSILKKVLYKNYCLMKNYYVEDYKNGFNFFSEYTAV